LFELRVRKITFRETRASEITAVEGATNKFAFPKNRISKVRPQESGMAEIAIFECRLSSDNIFEPAIFKILVLNYGICLGHAVSE
jgi:hypothetical protein